MANEQKILILYASAGHGHEKAAKAVWDAARAQGFENVSCIDILNRTSFGFGQRYRKGYLFMIRTVPWLWGFFYYLSDNPFFYTLIRPLRRIVNHLFASALETMVLDERADVVISTHFMSTEATAHLKKKGLTKSRLVTVVTDYLPHTFWLAPEVDLYCVACEETADELARRGVPREKIQITGIPIEAKFSETQRREMLRRSMELSMNGFTALLTSGGVGMGVLEPLMERLSIVEPQLDLLVVCGTNHAMRARLESKYGNRSNVRLFGFVNNIQELMAASDVIVGKGGGLTITESLAMVKPMVLFGAVPGQETRNVDVVLKRHAAKTATSIADAAECVQRYQREPIFYQATVDAIKAMRRPNAASDILKAALKT